MMTDQLKFCDWEMPLPVVLNGKASIILVVAGGDVCLCAGQMIFKSSWKFINLENGAEGI